MSAFHPFLNEPCPDWRGEVQHVRSEDEDWDGREEGGLLVLSEESNEHEPCSESLNKSTGTASKRL